MARYNAKDCIKYNTDVKREDEDFLTEEGEIFYSKVKISDDIQKHLEIAKSCPEHITLMLRCKVFELFLLKDITLTTTITTVTITTITI